MQKNQYLSTCCNAPGQKKPCVRDEDDKKAFKFSQSTLGTWRCSACGKKCSVTVKKLDI